MEPTPAQKLVAGCIIRVLTNQWGKPMKAMSKAQKKVGKVMGEYKAGKLHSGGTGKIVKNPRQAVAIALSSAGIKPKKKKS